MSLINNIYKNNVIGSEWSTINTYVALTDKGARRNKTLERGKAFKVIDYDVEKNKIAIRNNNNMYNNKKWYSLSSFEILGNLNYKVYYKSKMSVTGLSISGFRKLKRIKVN